MPSLDVFKALNKVFGAFISLIGQIVKTLRVKNDTMINYCGIRDVGSHLARWCGHTFSKVWSHLNTCHIYSRLCSRPQRC